MGSVGKSSVKETHQAYYGQGPLGNLVALYKNSAGDTLKCIENDNLYYVLLTEYPDTLLDRRVDRNKNYRQRESLITYGDDKNEMNNLVKKYLDMGFKKVDITKNTSGSREQKQKEIFDILKKRHSVSKWRGKFIVEYPSLYEAIQDSGYNDKETIHKIIVGMIKQGYIRRSNSVYGSLSGNSNELGGNYIIQKWF